MCRALGALKIVIFKKCMESASNWTTESVLYGVMCGMFHCVDCEKALINEDNRQERKLRIELCRLVVETHLGCFWNVFSLNVCTPLYLFYSFNVFIYRTPNLMRHELLYII